MDLCQKDILTTRKQSSPRKDSDFLAPNDFIENSITNLTKYICFSDTVMNYADNEYTDPLFPPDIFTQEEVFPNTSDIDKKTKKYYFYMCFLVPISNVVNIMFKIMLTTFSSHTSGKGEP